MNGRAKTLREFRDDWLTLQETVKRSLKVDGSLPGRENSFNDPLDCKDLSIPPLQTQIDDIADDFVHRWKTLDHRKVVVDGEQPQWYKRRVRLPENFQLDQEPDENLGTDERVISLDSQADILPYSSELWKLIDKVPMIAQVQETTFSGHGLQKVAALVNQDHARKRLRLSQQHDVIPQSARPLVATMRIECWKSRPSLDSLPDKNRLVLEFSESQTLLDVHNSLVTNAATNRGESSVATNEKGFFLIEGIFYVSKDPLAIVSIVDWLKADGIRRKNAGINETSIVVKKMDNTNLRDLKCRLGVRYCHQSSSSFESAVFVTDRRMTSIGHCFPIIHDTWFHSDVTCNVCSQPATRATATTSYLGHRALCSACCRLLRVPDADQRCYTVWEAG